MLYNVLPIADFSIAWHAVLLGHAILANDIIANITYIIIIPSSTPYAIPPALSICFIIGNSVIPFIKKLTTNNIILASKNTTIAEPIFTILIAICSADCSTTVFFASVVALSISLLILSIIEFCPSLWFSAFSSSFVVNVSIIEDSIFSSILVLFIIALEIGLYKITANTIDSAKEINFIKLPVSLSCIQKI